MKNFMNQIFRLVFRAAVLLAGLVFFSGLLVVAMLLLGLWLLRALWARLTGQPVSPWMFRVDPRAQWNRFNRRGDGHAQDFGRAQKFGRAARPGPGSGPVADRADVVDVVDGVDVADVTDVVAREIEPQDHRKDKSPDRRR